MADIIERLRSARCFEVDTFVAHALEDAEAEIIRLRLPAVCKCWRCETEFQVLGGSCPECGRFNEIE